jgi:general L-amino acid transport system substrate-binding protein
MGGITQTRRRKIMLKHIKKIKRCLIAMGAAISVCFTAIASAGTLEDVKVRGMLNCGVNTGLRGFSEPDANGNWKGLDVDLCRAIAAAVFGDAEKVEFKPLIPKERFTALLSGDVDLLSRNSTWTFSRDTKMTLDFVGINYYDGQGFMVNKSLGVTSAKELDGAKVCVQVGSTMELNLADFFRVNNMGYEPLPVDTNAEALGRYSASLCDVYTTNAYNLAAKRAAMPNPDNHVILPEIISKEPLGPVVRRGDDQWADVVRWSLNAMIAAEELDITSANVDDMMNSNKPEALRLLGMEGKFGDKLGLNNDWAYQIIKQVGNYGESFERNIGENTPLQLRRGLNALSRDGGLLYSPPFR